ncbi:cytochrome b-c1 complex subunit Rieske-4, mitochondrial [Physcomitrium patens]|uniref:Cytochrome b-c1 complex subunit Rieske, mitochondrial n=1 Tax=Physcomitrium patens TaxID=3218 RepID=A0A2K1IIJ4_PHYPA|nr:cytochrome b-c1 complex subunit Rieske-4, mitochondrial-like [Physcomitrium patens]PNR29097.1 hypothetical protein PHYPA_027789 [Physcomitrium patens]|eukprot:XP_024362967.1 cytochrome b-c1 complex subunit Rieske-4, mitochondrial-like [Physcomitrella patens]
MLARGLGRRLLVLARLAQSSQGASSAALVDLSSGYTTKEDRVVSDGGMALSPSSSFSRSWHFSRGFASDALAGTASGTHTVPATVQALKNISNEITYDEHTHERCAPGDPSKKAFTYLVLTGGRFIYASALRILALKLILSMSASRDVLAMASLEVDISSIEPGSTVTVKWRGKPVFVRHRTEADIKLANSTPMNELRDPEEDSVRVQNPEWLVVVGVCTHLGCVPLPNAGDYGGWFCPCHGSHYDISGRIRKGPAPYNLEVPQYKFTEETKLLIG